MSKNETYKELQKKVDEMLPRLIAHLNVEGAAYEPNSANFTTNNTPDNITEVRFNYLGTAYKMKPTILALNKSVVIEIGLYIINKDFVPINALSTLWEIGPNYPGGGFPLNLFQKNAVSESKLSDNMFGKVYEKLMDDYISQQELNKIQTFK